MGDDKTFCHQSCTFSASAEGEQPQPGPDFLGVLGCTPQREVGTIKEHSGVSSWARGLSSENVLASSAR